MENVVKKRFQFGDSFQAQSQMLKLSEDECVELRKKICLTISQKIDTLLSQKRNHPEYFPPIVLGGELARLNDAVAFSAEYHYWLLDTPDKKKEAIRKNLIAASVNAEEFPLLAVKVIRVLLKVI